MPTEKIYIVEVETLEQIECQYMPNELTRNNTAEINKIKTVARNNPFPGYSGVETDMMFSLDFYSEQEDREDLMSRVKWLEGLTYGQAFNARPVKIRIVWGRFLNKFTFCVNNVNVKFAQMNKYHDGLPLMAMVDLNLSLDMDENIVRSDIRG